MEAKLQRRIQRYGWDRAAADYEAFWSRQIEPAQERLLAMAALRRGERVLDVACGTGLVSFAAATQVGPDGFVWGTDISDGMIREARLRASARGMTNVRFDRADAVTPATADESFDAALCSLGLMYVPDPVEAIRTMRNALRPGGRVVTAVWGERSRCGWAGIFQVVDSRVKSEVCPMFFQLGTGDMLRMAMESGGLGSIEVLRISTRLDYSCAEEAIGAGFVGGPVAMAYSRFDARTRAEAHAEYLSTIEAYRTGERYSIPGEFVIARGVVD